MKKLYALIIVCTIIIICSINIATIDIKDHIDYKSYVITDTMILRLDSASDAVYNPNCYDANLDGEDECED